MCRLLGIVASVFENPLYPSRMLMLGFSILGIFCWYLLIRDLFGPWTALFFCMIYSSTSRFLEFADAMCNQSIDEFTRTAGLLIFWKMISTELGEDQKLCRRQWFLLAAFWTVVFVNSLNSVEFIIFYQILFLSFVLIRKWPKTLCRRTFAITLSAPLLGMFLHFIQTWIEHGSIQGVYNDWGIVVRERTFGHFIKGNPLEPHAI